MNWSLFLWVFALMSGSAIFAFLLGACMGYASARDEFNAYEDAIRREVISDGDSKPVG